MDAQMSCGGEGSAALSFIDAEENADIDFGWTELPPQNPFRKWPASGYHVSKGRALSNPNVSHSCGFLYPPLPLAE